MAPRRKRGATEVKTNMGLNLGDLVLAKVKGFPAWPAKICRPEDWDRSPEPKKIFVEFFGTSEIAFLPPTDLQSFTVEAKNKLSARRKGKAIKLFTQAVTEICEEFDAMQTKSIVKTDYDNAQNLASETETEPVDVDEALPVSINDSKDHVGQVCRSKAKGLDRCSQGEGEMTHKDACHSVSSHPSSGNRKKLSTNSNIMKEAVLGSPDAKVECSNSDGGKKEFSAFRKAKHGMGVKRRLEGTNNTKKASTMSCKLNGDGMQTKSAEMPKVVPKFDDERKLKKLHIGEKDVEAVDDDQVKTDHDGVIDTNEMKFHDHQKRISRTNDTSSSAKISKHGDGVEEACHFTDQDDHPSLNRQHRAMGTICSSALISEGRIGSSTLERNACVRLNNVRTPVLQLQKKRKAVLLCGGDVDDFSKTLLHARPRTPLHGRPRTPIHGGPRTPIHGGSNNRVSDNPSLSDSKRVNFILGKTKTASQVISKNPGTVDHTLKETVPRMLSVASPISQQVIKKKNRELLDGHRLPQVPNHIDKLPVCSPKRFPLSIHSMKLLAEHQKKESGEAPGNVPLKNSPSVLSRDPACPSVSERSNPSVSERSKPNSSEEMIETAHKSDAQINDSAVGGNLNVNLRLLGERVDADKDLETSFQVNGKMSDAAMPMKHLLATAQEKRRKAHMTNSCGNPLPPFPDGDMLGPNPSPTFAALAVEVNTILQFHAVGSHPTSPSCISVLANVGSHEDGEHGERRRNSGHEATGSPLCGYTEAAVARDAFEGMIETLSRTKESISRATRRAIDCAKYGIANEVVELLIKKLENEPNFHRKVDLFFLVDSITQYSHSQKGIAGAAYIPIVEAALPRIIGAVAPAGVVARENRKQCLKVLRLWLERKILPESVLLHCMDDIGAINDDTFTGFPHSRLSNSERSIDDPLREMEGILVDEYGSNTSFQLLGFLSCNLLKEEEDEEIFCTRLSEEGADAASMHNLENYASTPVDRHHCVLANVEGELEMEDISGHRDGKPLRANNASIVASVEVTSGAIPESASSEAEFLQSIEVTAPLPYGSPITPPLPTSPASSPPPLPPPPSLSPQSSQVLPPPPPSFPLVPPSSLPHVLPSPSISSPFISQRSSQPQAAYVSKDTPPVTPMMSGSHTLAHQLPPYRHESGDAPPRNQELHRVPSGRRMAHIDASVGGKQFSQQSSLSRPAGGSNRREHTSYNSSRHAKYEREEASLVLQTSQQRRSYVTRNVRSRQRPLHRGPHSQKTLGHFSYSNCIQQRQYPSCHFPDSSETRRRYAPDEKWPKRVHELNADYRHGDWMEGGTSCSGSHYSLEGPPPKRTHRSTVKSHANNQQAAPVSGSGYPSMPSKHYMAAINWKTTF